MSLQNSLQQERKPNRLLLDSRQYAEENVRLSWWYVGSSFFLLFSAVFVTVSSEINIWLRIAASIFQGFMFLRLFVLYHDFQHGAILRNSTLANIIMTTYGLCILAPPSIWTRSHNYHHKYNSKIYSAFIGSFPIMTTGDWDSASFKQRLEYRVARHPLIILLAPFTVFLLGMALRPLIINPRLHLDCALSLVMYFSLIFSAIFLGGWDVFLLAIAIPTTISTVMGAYLFYAQHNFPGVRFFDRENWSYVDAALYSSSYIPMSPIMSWITANIGYHHVHHLNHKIPFYRLPEAMKNIEGMQSPTCTTLRPKDIISCMQLKLWDTEQQRMVTFREHQAAQHTALA